MATELEQVELEIKRTQLAREQLALRQEQDRHERPAKAAQEFKQASQAVKVAAQEFAATTLPTARGAARMAAFVALWVILTAVSDMVLAWRDVRSYQETFEWLLGAYFFCALAIGTLWTLCTWPWAGYGPKKKAANETNARLVAGGVIFLGFLASAIVKALT